MSVSERQQDEQHVWTCLGLESKRLGSPLRIKEFRP